MVAVTRPHYRYFKPVAPEKTFNVDKGNLFYLAMKEVLIQGAVPTNTKVLESENFQGGYRCELKIITPPSFGTVEVSPDFLGFDYRPVSSHWSGHDSFSYSVVNVMGCESDANCVHVFVGL